MKFALLSSLRRALPLTAAITVMMSPSAQAQTATERWAQLQATLSANNTLQAHEISSTYSMFGDDEKTTGRYKTVAQTAPANGEPVRTQSEHNKESDMGMKSVPLSIGLPERFANHPAELFTNAASFELAGQETIDGATFSLLTFHARTAKGKLPITATVWINDKTGHPLRVRGVIEPSPFPGNKIINFSIAYASDGQGRSLPLDVAVNYTMSLLFHTVEFSFSHHLADWREH